jgi:8-oxo-dGTP pyrophosphatase MutT (NUDIX family)
MDRRATTSNQPDTAAEIPHAATVILLRESAAGPQVLLTKRAAGLAFMASLWVFPGGRMEASDHCPAVLPCIAPDALIDRSHRLLSLQGAPLHQDAVLGLHVAACRETFEEAGVMLGRPRAGGFCSAAQLARLAARRAEASSGGGFARLLAEEDLVLDPGGLTYWSHWITPARERRRFDTHFFAVEVPHDQEASADHSELTHHAWLTADEIATRILAGELQMSPPTIATLEDVWASHARHGSIAAMLREERLRHVPTILPKIVNIEGAPHVLLPWDPQYEESPEEGCPLAGSCPPHLARLPSRRPALFTASRKPLATGQQQTDS